MPNSQTSKQTILQRISDGREYRAMPLMTPDNEEYTVHGYACTFSQTYELYRSAYYVFTEEIAPDAFAECDMADVIMQYDHQGHVYARMSNKTLEAAPDPHGLLIRAILGGTTIGRQLYEEIKGGYTTKMSFGFRVGADRYTEEEDHETGCITEHRTILKISKLYDVSAVSLPANDATEISARSLCDGLIERIQAERQARARDRKIFDFKLKMSGL